jgi:hypothetical protein
MRSNTFKSLLVKSGLASSVLLLAGGAGFGEYHPAGRQRGADVGLQLRHGRGWFVRHLREVESHGSRLVASRHYGSRGGHGRTGNQPDEQSLVQQRQ